ncbi:MAG: DegT/DnrJ/EryC1/StrS family aminotransferase [Candidatus Omnitrophota bacterium]
MERRVPFLDLRILDDQSRNDLLEAINKVFLHGRFILGPEVQEFEEAIASYCGRKYAVGVNSGTDALYLGLKSLDLGRGDEVITTSLSWIASANAIAMTGATPVFADIRDDLNIDPLSIEKLISPKTKAIVPVHYTGKVCRMPEIMELAQKHNLIVIEDAAQAFGARLNDQVAGSYGRIACFSMNPMKVFAACGEAGVVVTDEKELYDRLIYLRYNGVVNRETCYETSLNGRMDTIQAAVLLQRLRGLSEIIETRRRFAAIYQIELAGIVDLPCESAGEWNVYYTFTIRASRRDELKTFLEAQGVETKIQHPILMPEQPAYRNGVKGEYPNAQRLLKRILCVPCHEKLTEDDIHYVIKQIKEFYRSGV